MQLARRRLPHLYEIGKPLFVTFRLHNTLPANRTSPDRLPSGKAFVTLDRLLDEERAGASYMRIPEVAAVVVASIRAGAPGQYLLHTWVVMPNHVHLLITPKIDPSEVLRKMKGVSARDANRLLGATGQPFWQDKSFDRLVRNETEFQRIGSYILQNPVRAGLAQSEGEYRWSSAFEAGGLKPVAG